MRIKDWKKMVTVQQLDSAPVGARFDDGESSPERYWYKLSDGTWGWVRSGSDQLNGETSEDIAAGYPNGHLLDAPVEQANKITVKDMLDLATDLKLDMAGVKVLAEFFDNHGFKFN